MITAKLCPICMERHDVHTVQVTDEQVFKGVTVLFEATYVYCTRR